MEHSWINHPTIIRTQTIELIPLEINLLDKLFEAASDTRIWEFYIGDWSVRETFNKIYKTTLAQRNAGREYPFVIYHRDEQKIIGSTRFMDIVQYDRRIEIGGTWLLPQYWSTIVNLECKLAMMSFCFDTLKANRIQLKTQHDNIRSRKAIEKIGGIYEGTFRQHMLKDNGTYRSSAYFSILNSEWPNVKQKIQKLISDKMIALK